MANGATSKATGTAGIVFTHDKTTKNGLERYSRSSEEGGPVTGSLYLSQAVSGIPPAKTVTVTVGP